MYLLRRSRYRGVLVLWALTTFAGWIHAQEWNNDDFSWMHGANYTPSYAATDVETWLMYDHAAIDRELGYAEKIGLNTIRVFLQSLVYHHDPERFLARFEDLLATSDRHGIRVMPIIFDSCFGVSPSLESQHMWVANPGPDKMDEEFWPESDAYVRALVEAHVGDRRIVMWDVMNEPRATTLMAEEGGWEKIKKFLRHSLVLVKKIDSTHPVTVGVAGTDSSAVIDLVDVISIHSYAATRAKYIQALEAGRQQAHKAGKPWIISETGAPGWGNTYEMIMPILREYKLGHTVWEVVIGENQFRNISGLFYPDGTVRRIGQIEAVMNAPVEFLVEKSDSEGVPIASNTPGRVGEYLEFVTRNPVTEETWRERNTIVYSVLQAMLGEYEGRATMAAELEKARAAYRKGDKAAAFKKVGALLREGAGVILEREDEPVIAPPP